MLGKTLALTIALTAGAITPGQTMEVRVCGVLDEMSDPPPHDSPLAGLQKGDAVEWVLRYQTDAAPNQTQSTGTVYPAASETTFQMDRTVCATAPPGDATVMIDDDAPGPTPRDVLALSAFFDDIDHTLLLHATDLDATAFDDEALPDAPVTLSAFEHVTLILLRQTSPTAFADEVGRYTLTRFRMTLLPACPADLDGDGRVGATDLGLLMAAWGSPGADLSGDGLTGPTDLGLLLGAWGGC